MDAGTRARLRGLPKESSARVLLAVLAFVVGSIVVGEAVWLTAYRAAEARVIATCRRTATNATGFLTCERGAEHDRVLWTIAWGPAALGLAVAGGAAGSWFRRRRLTPFPVDRLPAVEQLSTGAATGVGLVSAPPLLWSSVRPIAMARADGFLRPYVEVGPGLLSRSLRAPAAAGATFRHEDAHVKLRDIAPSRVMWWSGPVGAAALVAFVAAAWDTGFGTVRSALWRLALIAFAVAAARASVLRAREFDADLCAAASDPDSVVVALQGSDAAPRWWDGVAGVFHHHPPLGERRRAVCEPWRACELGVVDALLVGLTTAIAAPTFTRITRTWFLHGDLNTYAEVVGWGIAGAVTGAWLVMMLLRAVVGAREAGTRLRLGAFAWTLAVVLLVGQRVYAGGLYNSIHALPDTALGWATFVALPVGVVVAVLWLRGAIELWLDGWADAYRRAGARWLAVTIGAVLTGLLLGTLATVEHAGAAFDRAPAAAVLQGVDPHDPFTVFQVLQLVSRKWFVVLLTGIAFLVPALLATLSPAARAGARRALIVAAGAVVVGLLAYAAFWHGWDPVTDASRHGWYAVARTATSPFVIVGGTVACAAAMLSIAVRTSPVTFAGFAAVCAGVPAAIGAWLIAKWEPHLWYAVTDVVAVALLGGLLGSAVLVALRVGGRTRPRWPAVVALVTVAGAVGLVGFELGQTDVRTSVAADRSYYWSSVSQALPPALLGDLLQRDCNGFAGRSALVELRAVGRRLDDVTLVPSTRLLRSYHEALRGLIDRCADANAHAVRAGSPTFLAVDQPAFARARQDYVTAGRAILAAKLGPVTPGS